MADEDVVNKKVFYLSDLSEDIYHWANAFCLALCGKQARKVPRLILRTLGLIGDVVSFLTRKPFYITSSRVNSMTSNYLVPGWIEQTLAVLGPPKYDLKEGVRMTADWFLLDRITTQQKKRIVVAGQVPPPIGGQNIMIQKTLDTLRQENLWTIEHLPLNFNATFTKIRAFSLSKVIELARIILRILKFRTQEKIDLMIYPFGGKHKMPMIRDMILLPLCLLTTKKVVVWFHTGGIAEQLHSLSSRFRFAYLGVFSRVHAAIVMTNFNKCDPHSLGISEIHVIPHHIPDVAEKHSRASSQQQIKILYLGHLYPDKGILELLEAFDSIADQNESVFLDLVGEAIAPWSVDSLSAIIAKMQHSNRVTFHGLALGDEKNAHFQNASMLVFPSIAPGESFGLVLAEGLMWGLPIVATDWRGAKDVLTPAFYGRMVDCNPMTGTKLANAIVDLITKRDEWSFESARNRKIFLDLYCESSESNLLIDTVHKILADSCCSTGSPHNPQDGDLRSDLSEQPPLKLTIYTADQNAFQGRSYGIMRMTGLILSVLAKKKQINMQVVSSSSSLQSPIQGGNNTKFPWSTKSRLMRVITDHIYPLIILFRKRCDVWYFPKGFLSKLDSLCSPSVVTIHDTIIQYYQDHYPKWRSRWSYAYWATMLKHTLHKADRILTVSESSKSQILAFMDRHRIPRKEITVTYEPCLYEMIPQPENPTKENHVIHLASCEPHKRTAHLIRWWHEAEQAGRSLPMLHLIGNVPEEVEPLLACSYSMAKRPFLEDAALQATYQEARALILPSEIEGFGLPALEAYYLGTPVCYVKGTSVEEILCTTTCKGGFSLDSADTLFAALDQVMAMSPEEVRECGLKLREIYAAEKVAERMVEVFDDVKNLQF